MKNSQDEKNPKDPKIYLNLMRSEAINHYKTEKAKTEEKKEEKKAETTAKAEIKPQTAVNTIADFFENRFFSWIYHYFRSRFGKKSQFKNYDSSDNGIYKIPEAESEADEIKIALVSDWATDTEYSDKIAREIEEKDPHYTIHLGDIYFVGMNEEVSDNFEKEKGSWHRGSLGSFALPGNHEMYSRGISYFRDLLPTLGIASEKRGEYLGQKASYFCLENNYWRIIGLDTGYNSVGFPLIEWIFPPKCEFENEIINWLDKTLNLKNDKRGIVILTHHQYCSAFEKNYEKPAEQLAGLIGQDRPVLWFWGHEHRFSVYGKYKSASGITAYGRCIGHGGMPVEFKEKINNEKAKAYGLVLYDEREYQKIENTAVGYNGYAILKLKNELLAAEYFDIDENILFKEKWIADKSGTISQIESEILCKDIGFIEYRR